MKKLTLLIALFTIITVGAQAADPAMTGTKIIEKVQVTKKKLAPAIASKIKPGMMIAKPDDSSDETPEDTTDATDTTGTYALDIGEIQLSTDPATCATKWHISVTNAGTAASPAGIKTSPVVFYDADENGEVEENQLNEHQLSPIAPGQEEQIVGWVPNTFPNLDRLVINLKDGEDVLDTASVLLPDEGDYSISLGDSAVVGNQFSVSIENEGTASVPSLLVVFQGITSAEPIAIFRIVENTLHCVPAGETRTMSISVATQDHVGYRVMVYRTGETDILAMRDYIL